VTGGRELRRVSLKKGNQNAQAERTSCTKTKRNPCKTGGGGKICLHAWGGGHLSKAERHSIECDFAEKHSPEEGRVKTRGEMGGGRGVNSRQSLSEKAIPDFQKMLYRKQNIKCHLSLIVRSEVGL